MNKPQAVNSSVSLQGGPAASVYLPYVSDDPNERGLEPQYVKIKPNNRGLFTLSLAYQGPGDFPVINSIVNVRRVSRISPTAYRGYWNIPNVNPKNNVLVFRTGGVTYTITIPEGYYTVADLVTTTVALMNAAVGGPWVLTATLLPNSVNVYNFSLNLGNTLEFIGGSASWSLPDAPLSEYLLDFRRNGGLVNSFTCNPRAVYTPYIDIASAVLTQDSKTGQVDLSQPANFIHRQHINNPLPNFISEEIINGVIINVSPFRMLSSIDISLTDSSGTYLYIPDWDYNFDFALEISAVV
jgi:hypothetical protein